MFEYSWTHNSLLLFYFTYFSGFFVGRRFNEQKIVIWLLLWLPHWVVNKITTLWPRSHLTKQTWQCCMICFIDIGNDRREAREGNRNSAYALKIWTNLFWIRTLRVLRPYGSATLSLTAPPGLHHPFPAHTKNRRQVCSDWANTESYFNKLHFQVRNTAA